MNPGRKPAGPVLIQDFKQFMSILDRFYFGQTGGGLELFFTRWNFSLKFSAAAPISSPDFRQVADYVRRPIAELARFQMPDVGHQNDCRTRRSVVPGTG